jgi:hypothetical protein
MMNFLENKFSPAKRLYHLRHTVCHNRLIFCERHAISPHTLSAWEKGKKPVTEKGANKLIEAFAKEGILCSVEWLLHGVGLSPTTLEDFTSSIKIEEISIIEKHKNSQIQSEVALFIAQNPTAKIFKMSDDSMEPALFEEDLIGAVLTAKNKVRSLIKKPCVFIESNDNCHIRLLVLSKDKETYNLASLNAQTKQAIPVLFNVTPKEIYKIVWIRRKN